MTSPTTDLPSPTYLLIKLLWKCYNHHKNTLTQKTSHLLDLVRLGLNAVYGPLLSKFRGRRRLTELSNVSSSQSFRTIRGYLQGVHCALLRSILTYTWKNKEDTFPYWKSVKAGKINTHYKLSRGFNFDVDIRLDSHIIRNDTEL